jgi:sucrose-6-phosphate hydrolase SacC (GH32 family)
MDYVMFYIGYRDIDTANICVAKSPDGLTRWEKSRFNPLVVPTPDGWDAAACYKPSVLWDEKENRWMLWYNGRVGHDERIGLVLKTGRELF